MAEFDNIREEHNRIPSGWLLFYIGLILWLIWYIYSYTPEISGWSYYKIYESRAKEMVKTQAVIPTENPYEHNDKAIAEGKTIYMENCAVCHGDNLRGGVGPDLTGHLKYGETDDKKYETIARGRGGGMPPFGQQLGRDRIWKVLAYVDSVRGMDKSHKNK
ncbi:MAG TPA: c-type cytochrome [Nitrospirae bacterium]|nr:c-type cytochrome [Nitrospirota bacterium]